MYTSSKIARDLKDGTKIRFAIRPDDISLSTQVVVDISISNQLKGIVKNIIYTKTSTFCEVDCGVKFIVEVTDSALDRLMIEEGSEVYCLIKAKAIEVIYVER